MEILHKRVLIYDLYVGPGSVRVQPALAAHFTSFDS